MEKVFLLSPANCGGLRARMVVRPGAVSGVARRLREEGVPLGELFTFLSGLYFRGKLAYASTFADPPPGCPGVLIITPGRGLMTPETRLTTADLIAFARSDIHESDPDFAFPFSRDAQALDECAGPQTDIILLGSIATRKYVAILLDRFDRRLKFPGEFVGRGDMSRGGLLLRRAADSHELHYIPVEGAVLHGRRPPRLTPRRYGAMRAPDGEGRK